MSDENQNVLNLSPRVQITWAEISEELKNLRNLSIAASDSETRRFALDAIATFHRAYLLPSITVHDHFSPHRYNR